MIDLKKIWDAAFLEEIADVEEKTGSNPVDWRVGGRATKEYPDKENKLWWDAKGYEMFQNFVTSYNNNKWQIWTTPQGLPAIELGMNCNFGDVPVKAFADLVFQEGDELAVVDLKTGASTPESSMQLGVYASCVEMTFGIRPTKGYYYSARSATLEPSYGIERWTIPVLTELFTQFDKGIKAEIFLPNVGMNCRTCGVKDYCYAVGGELAQIYDPLAVIK